MGSGTLRRHGLVGGGVSLCRKALRAASAQAAATEEELLSFWLPSDQHVELSAPSPASLAAYVSCHGDNGLNL